MADAPAPILTRALVLAMVLAGTAGFVDAHVFLHVTQAFVANQSGNLIHLGMDVGRTDWLVAFRSALAIGSFVGGVAIATRVQRRDASRGAPARPEVLLAGESVLLLVLALFLFTIDPEPLRRPGAGELLAVAIGAVAMGIQAAALTRAGSVAVTTTYETGSLVRVGQNLLGGESRTVAVLALVVASYVGGAAVSAALGGATALMLVPVAMMAAAAWLERSECAATP